MTENEIASIVFKTSLQIHNGLWPGLLESTYQECLFHEIRKRGIFIEKQKPLPLIYKETKLEIGYRIDLMIGK